MGRAFTPDRRLFPTPQLTIGKFMAAKNRAGNPNKRPGSKCYHKMMSPKAAARRKRIYLYNTRQQSNLKWQAVERQNQKEYQAA